MARYFSSWRINPALIPTNPEERMKLWHMMLERVKAEMKAGEMDAWGITPSFTGYTIHEMNEKEALAATSSWAPYVLVDKLEPILTPEEALDAMKRLGAKK
jgi:hypothetical protein